MASIGCGSQCRICRAQRTALNGFPWEPRLDPRHRRAFFLLSSDERSFCLITTLRERMGNVKRGRLALLAADRQVNFSADAGQLLPSPLSEGARLGFFLCLANAPRAEYTPQGNRPPVGNCHWLGRGLCSRRACTWGHAPSRVSRRGVLVGLPTPTGGWNGDFHGKWMPW